MKKCLLILLCVCGASVGFAQLGSQEFMNEGVADFVYFYPSQQYSGFYDRMLGGELQYRAWLFAPWGVGVSVGALDAKVRRENPDRISPDQGVFSGSAQMYPLGISALCRILEIGEWRATLEAGIRYVIIESDVELELLVDGKKETVDMDNCLTGHFGIDVDYLLSEQFALFAGLGAQVDLDAGEMSTESKWLFDNNLKGYEFRVGGKLSF